MDELLLSETKFSWWKQRSAVEKCFLIIISLSVIVIICLAACLLVTVSSTKEKSQSNVCMTEKCIRSAASILEKIDKSVDPCEDFYQFACGNFIKNTMIPIDEKQVSLFTSVEDKINLHLIKLFEEPKRDSDSSSLKLIKTIYSSCMNTTKIEQEGLKYAKKVFEDLGGWPLIETNWNEDVFDWKNLLYSLYSHGWTRNFFLNVDINTDRKNFSRNILTLTPPPKLSGKVKSLNVSFNDSTVKAVYNYMIKLALLFDVDKKTAISDIKDVIDFEIDFSNFILFGEEKHTTQHYNPITIKDLQIHITDLPWLQLLNNYLSPIDKLTSEDVINVSTPKFFEKLGGFLSKTKKRTLANYMFLRLLRALIRYLPKAFRIEELEYIRIVYGKNLIDSRWKRCILAVENLPIAVSSLYVKNFFANSTKDKVNELTTDIRNAFMDTLKKVTWMDKRTKQHALEKAEKMGTLIGYPEELLDDKKVEQYYEGLELDSNDGYMKNDFTIFKFAHMKYIRRLKKHRIPLDWEFHADVYKVNAYYMWSENIINIPAAVLQDDFYDPDRPQYMNYGAIGEIIGREITHGFDNFGRQFDKDGNMSNWWELETIDTFNKKSHCLREQYGNYTVPEVEMKLNGVITLAENIADNGGIKNAYKGYLKWLERNEPELLLPGLPYTGRQLFWLSAATNWCTKYTKEYLREKVTSEVHPPNHFRIVGAFMNSDLFGKDFNCPLGSRMNPVHKCSLW